MFHFKWVLPTQPSRTLTRVFWIADSQWTPLYFLLEKVFLVEEEDDGGVCKPFVVTNAVKEFHAFVHAVLKKK